MIKVLSVVSGLGLCDGVASHVINYYRHLDSARVRMDFALLKATPSPFADEVRSRGDRIFVLPPIRRPAAFCREIRRILQSERYDVLHANVVNVSAPLFAAAKRCGVPARILHSHAARSGEVRWKKLRNDLLGLAARRGANAYLACSRIAGDALFGDRPYTLIRNALEVGRYRFREDVRAAVRKERGVPANRPVIGVVGRIAHQKNPFFAAEVLAAALRREPGVVCWWIGSGPLEERVRRRAEALGIGQSVSFLGERGDLPALYQAMDVLLLPSLYEGLPMAGIEAQAAGLPLVASDAVTRELQVTPQVVFLPLEASPETWAAAVLSAAGASRADAPHLLAEAGYDVAAAARQLEEVYENLVYHREGSPV